MQPPRVRLPRDLSPFDELREADQAVLLAAQDEEKRCFDPNCHPKAPHPKEEPVTDSTGTRIVDMGGLDPVVDPNPVGADLEDVDVDPL